MNSEGLVELERVRVRCPACGQEVLASVSDGRVRGYCAISRQRVDFIAVDNPTPETAEISASGPDPDEVKDGVVRDYLAGDKAVVIQEKHGITPGKMYRVLHGAGVKLRRH